MQRFPTDPANRITANTIPVLATGVDAPARSRILSETGAGCNGSIVGGHAVPAAGVVVA